MSQVALTPRPTPSLTRRVKYRAQKRLSRLEAPDYLGRVPAGAATFTRPSDNFPFQPLDRFVSWTAVAIGLVGAVLLTSILVSGDTQTRDVVIAGALVMLGLVGAVSLYASSLLSRPALPTWQQAVLAVIIKPLCILILLPVVLILLPVAILWLVAWTSGWFGRDAL